MNPLVSHGAPTLSPNGMYLTHADGTPFFWLADTWWYGATVRTPWNAFTKLVCDRKRKGFTVIQLVVGYPPEVSLGDPSSRNEGGFPTHKDGSINPLYFEAVDKKIKYLVENGIVPCIVGGWGHHMTLLGEQTVKALWTEIIKRYGSYPVIWCLTGEVDLLPPIDLSLETHTIQKMLFHELKSLLRFSPARFLFGLWKKIKQSNPTIPSFWQVRHSRTRPESGISDHDSGQARVTHSALFHKEQPQVETSPQCRQWARVARYIKTVSPNRLLTVHVNSRQSASHLFHNPSWLDIDSIQSGHTKENAGFLISSAKTYSASRPFINLEPWYEGIHGDFGPDLERFAFWASVLSGAKGHTYGAHGIWNMATNSDPFLSHWGVSDWQGAMHFKGGEQIGKGKQWLMQFPWWRLLPDSTLLKTPSPTHSPYEPLCARIDKQYILVYMPVGRICHSYTLLGLSKNRTYTLSYISPKTLRTKKQVSFSNCVTYTIHTPTPKDWLVLIH